MLMFLQILSCQMRYSNHPKFKLQSQLTTMDLEEEAGTIMVAAVEMTMTGARISKVITVETVVEAVENFVVMAEEGTE